MILRICLFLPLLFLTVLSRAQVKVGQWNDHLCYNYANSVARAGSFVYVSNGSGLARYHVSDNSIEKLTKINGLSDIGVKLLRYNPYNNTLMIIYDNANIDIIQNDAIINFSDIKRKVITGNKVINEVYFHNQYAYLACGFGIIVFDTDKLEIKDTYYIGNGGSNVFIYQVASNDTSLLAATETGIYYANTNTLLNNYQNWHKVNGLPVGPYNGISIFNSDILCNYSAFIKSNQSPTAPSDTIYQFDGAAWSKFSLTSFPYTIRRMYNFNDNSKTAFVDNFGLKLLKNTVPNLVSYVTNYGFATPSINDMFYEDHSPNYNLFWIADNNYGLVESKGGYPDPNSAIPVNGPSTNFAADLDVNDGYLYVAPTDLGPEWSNSYVKTALDVYQEKQWNTLHPIVTDTMLDINCVAVDPNDKRHVAYGSWGNGLLEMRNNSVVHAYNTINSSLQGAYGTGVVRIGGLLFDKNSNLWVSASHNNKFLNILKPNGTWSVLDFTNFISSNPTSGKILIDKNDQTWLQLPRGVGMLIYKGSGAFPQPNNSNTKMVTVAKNSGALPTNDVYSMAEDKDGHIWVGTGEGIAVFYNPENVFNGGNWDSQQILIEQDGHVQILLQTEVVTAIAVDGANRKWVGTQSSGVYCFSPDGLTQIYHFAIDNSPLYSNTVRDIVTDETTGDVFIATDKGIQSYRTVIIKGFDDFTNVHAYPNPIRPGYNSNVYITGLIDEAIVKVTDVAGNLVWETKSEGGQIEWDLKTFSGTRVASGVYVIYCASSDGAKTAVTKLLVVN
ncbi:MAG: T9SS type A sorting domain-containing protein [Bacteroidetes bacterium]|nr:T9SS type A sorting domain-containing protein [Bacteroidota bacterium]